MELYLILGLIGVSLYGLTTIGSDTNQKGGARKRKSGKTMKKIRKNKNKKSKRNH